MSILEKRMAPEAAYRTTIEPPNSRASIVDAKISRMLRITSRIGKELWSDLVFVVIIHLLLLALYAFTHYSLPRFAAIVSQPQCQFYINATLPGVWSS